MHSMGNIVVNSDTIFLYDDKARLIIVIILKRVSSYEVV